MLASLELSGHGRRVAVLKLQASVSVERRLALGLRIERTLGVGPTEPRCAHGVGRQHAEVDVVDFLVTTRRLVVLKPWSGKGDPLKGPPAQVGPRARRSRTGM